MQNMYIRHAKFDRLFRCAVIFFIIASLLVYITCSVSNSNRFYFATQYNGESTLCAQYLSSSVSLHFDFAGEETLRSATSSYSNFNHSIMRSQKSSYQSNMIITMFLLTAILILFNNLRSYGYQVLPKQNFSSVRIARFIEHSDGKK